MKPLVSLLSSIGLIALLLYGGLCATLYFWQTRLIFFPPRSLDATPAAVNLAYEPIELPIENAIVTGWWIPAARDVQNAPVLLYFHGNASNIGDLVNRAARFHQMGLSVLLVDYRGYGASTGGFPSEESVYEDAIASWDYLTQKRQIPPERIFLFGQSIGGAVAIDLASRQSQSGRVPGGIIVESTFSSLRDMTDVAGYSRFLPIDLLLTQRFDSLAKVRSLKAPILLIHGTDDRTVPTTMSQRLYEAASQPKQLLLIPGANHNDVSRIGDRIYWEAIEQFVQKFSRSSRGK
ncbi:alpha/beta hydrolase [Leptolyngbya ohadii]|uniref:alpha/beta hydrolase n=1 Tax=Leptolyngbya ohadii TaxID=1962290 RepID=UPI000B5A05FE|nr:alpha/beta hydrolase [Leptolyngbya ohadii]